MQLRNKSSNLSIKSQVSISSVSSAAKSFITRKFTRKTETPELRHAQSMPLSAASRTISPPLIHTAVDTGRGRYIRRVPVDLFNAIPLPCAPLDSSFNVHRGLVGEVQTDLTSIFEPRPVGPGQDLDKENVFEPRSFIMEDRSRLASYSASRNTRQRSASMQNKCYGRQWETTTHDRRGVIVDWHTLQPGRQDLFRPLSPVREEEGPSRRYGNYFGFPAVDGLGGQVHKLPSE